MKTLTIIRHAKSSWDDASLSDIDRPLNDRGNRTAPKMAKIIHKIISHTDLIISSPALRAKSTAFYFADEFKINREEIKLDKQIYAASVADLIKCISNVDSKFNNVLLFGHNPELTMLVNRLGAEIDNIPTCGAVGFNILSNDWHNFQLHSQFAFCEFPKKHNIK